MKRSTLLFTALAFALWAVPVFAQGHSGGHAAGVASGAGAPSGAGSSVGRGSAKGTGHETSSDSTGRSAGAETKQLNNFFTKTDSKLYSNISALATKDGTSITALQGMGFKNLGRMIAALHVYNNLGLASKTPPVSFADFATAATTGSLGKAIRQFDPTAHSSSELKKGTKQANDDMKENG